MNWGVRIETRESGQPHLHPKMSEEKKYKSTKRFGARYGRTVKRKVGEIEERQHKKYKCPYCNKEKVKRLSAGIWFCTKCKTKFTGGAYSL